eukprot:scaffold4950_cov161-Chaetoceros_neogracile.AAC.2
MKAKDKRGTSPLPKKRSRLVSILAKAFLSTCPPPLKSKFEFKNTAEAAKKNAHLLLHFKGNLQDAIDADGNSCLSPSTEFRQLEFIQPLLDLHEDGQKLVDIVSQGVSYPMRSDIDYTEELRISDVKAAIAQGNNKSTSGHDKLIQSKYKTEVERGWMMPIPLQAINAIEGLGITPIGIANQTTLNDKGEVIGKKRITHDCSRPGASGYSINNRVDEIGLEECRFGLCLLRILYQIHQLRVENPTTRILLSKFDFDAAYRRLHVLLKMALLCTTIVGPFAYLLFRLPFGSSPAAGCFSLLSEYVVDLAQALVEDISWCPSQLRSKMADSIPPMEPATDKPFGIARELSVNIHAKEISFDCYIDDMIVVCLMVKDNVQRALNAIPLILDSLFRPIMSEEPVERNPILSVDKLLAEGRLEEMKKTLGWIIDTRSLILYHPSVNSKLLVLEIDSMLNLFKKKMPIDRKKLECLIGKLNNIAFLMPEGRFFLNRLRFRHRVSIRQGQNKLFDEMEGADLLLWRKISIILREDASEFALGGFFAIGDHGFAWRFELPLDLQGIFSLNLLEFIAAFWTMKTPAELIRCINSLNIVDSTNALSWMVKNNHRPDLQPLHDEVARRFGLTLFETNSKADGRHLAGDRNKVSDSLSRDTHMPSSILIQQLRNHPDTKKIMPKFFDIYHQNEASLCSWLREMAQKDTKVKPSQKRRIPSKLATVGVKNDPFLQNRSSKDRFEQSDYIESYMYMYRFNYFGTKPGGGTIGRDRLSQSISHIAARFTNEGFNNPTHDRSGNRKASITKQLKAYNDLDPAVERQHALPASVFEFLYKDKSCYLNSAIGELTAGALFYAMRSCEYSSTEGNPKTKLLTLGDFFFYKKGKLINTNRQSADNVKIIFRTQKSGVKDEPAVRGKAPKNHSLCPVHIWAKIVDRVWSYKGSTDETPINTILVNDEPRLIKASTVRLTIRRAVLTLGEANLGIKASKIPLTNQYRKYTHPLSPTHNGPLPLAVGASSFSHGLAESNLYARSVIGMTKRSTVSHLSSGHTDQQSHFGNAS